MPTVAGSTGVQPHELVTRTAAELWPDLDRHIDACFAHIAQHMPELRDDELALGLLESAGDNFRVLFAAQRDGVAIRDTRAPRGAITYAEIMVRRGVPLATLLRAYRMGIQFLMDLWGRELRERHGARVRPDELVAALDYAMQTVFEYVDRVCDEVTEAYSLSRERWHRSASALRAETVDAVLDHETSDVDGASRRLGYELRRHHVAFVISATGSADGCGDDLRQLESAGQWLAGTLGCGRPLLVPRGLSALWVWAGFEEAPSEEALAQLHGRHKELAGLTVACGEPGVDVDGFRASHVDAEHACEVAARTPRAAGKVARYAKVVVPSLLLADPDRARAFALRELGALGAGDDSAARVRATLLTFLECGSRTATTARRLGIHQNTVAYRLHQAQELLGHPVAERRFEVEAALRLLPLLG